MRTPTWRVVVLFLGALACWHGPASAAEAAIRWSRPKFLERFQVDGPRAYAEQGPEGVRLLVDRAEFLPGQRWLEIWIDRGDGDPASPLEAVARLADPYPDDGAPQTGSVALAPNQPGLWHFKVAEDGLVSTGGGVPPVFAQRDPKAWFNPLETWPELASAQAAEEADEDRDGE